MSVAHALSDKTSYYLTRVPANHMTEIIRYYRINHAAFVCFKAGEQDIELRRAAGK